MKMGELLPLKEYRIIYSPGADQPLELVGYYQGVWIYPYIFVVTALASRNDRQVVGVVSDGVFVVINKVYPLHLAPFLRDQVPRL